MSTWTDDRIETALSGLATTLDLGDAPASSASRVDRGGRRRSARRLMALAAAAAAAMVAVLAAMLVVPSSRAEVTDWIGVGRARIHRTADGPRVAASRLIDEMSAIATATALAEAGPAAARLDTAGLGRPDAAGRLPEGGVVLVWAEGAVTLWAADVQEAAQIGKFGTAGVDIRPLPDVAPEAVLVDGRHELWTPIRTVAAERVIWWVDGQRQYRLESDLPADELIAIADVLAG